MSISKLLNLAACIVLVALAPGCTSFGRQWKAALRSPASQDGISGAWEGRWVSEVNGHNGRLRCVMTPLTNHQTEAFFHAKYMKILSFSYKVPLTVEPTVDGFDFKGEADLGKLAGGVYACEGATKGDQFSSAYRSKYDHGRFEMRRLDGKK